MDKPDMAIGKKGIVLTLDALSALALLLISAVLILMLMNRPLPLEAYGFEPAIDLMGAMKTMEMDGLAENPRYPYAASIFAQNLTSGYNASVANAIGELYLANRTNEARNLSQEFVGNALPAGFGAELLIEQPGLDCQNAVSEFSCIYSRQGPEEKTFVSVDRHLIYSNGVNREMRLVMYK